MMEYAPWIWIAVAVICGLQTLLDRPVTASDLFFVGAMMLAQLWSMTIYVAEKLA